MKALLENLAKRIDSVKWGGIVIENGSLSQGRLMGWVLFGLMIYLWAKTMPVPESLMLSWLATLGYNAGKKLTDPFKVYMEAKKGAVEKPVEAVSAPRVTEIDALEDENERRIG